MGKIIDEIQKYNKSKIYIKPIQQLTLEILDLLFQQCNISNISIEYEIGIGERGNYQNEENHLLKIYFDYDNIYVFEFYLYYDQLEYYILKNKKIMGKCNLEDYTNDVNKIVSTYIKYLKKQMRKLNIHFNDLDMLI